MALQVDLQNVKESLSRLADKIDTSTERYIDTSNKLTENTTKLDLIENQLSKQSTTYDNLVTSVNDVLKKIGDMDKNHTMISKDIFNELDALKANSSDLEKRLDKLDVLCEDLQSDKKSLLNSIKTIKTVGVVIAAIFAVLGYAGFNVSSIKINSDIVQTEQKVKQKTN